MSQRQRIVQLTLKVETLALENQILRVPCSLKGEVNHDLPKHFTPLDVLERVTLVDILVDLLLSENNLYAQQFGRNLFSIR